MVIAKVWKRTLKAWGDGAGTARMSSPMARDLLSYIEILEAQLAATTDALRQINHYQATLAVDKPRHFGATELRVFRDYALEGLSNKGGGGALLAKLRRINQIVTERWDTKEELIRFYGRLVEAVRDTLADAEKGE